MLVTLLISLGGFLNFGFSIGASVKPLTTLMLLFYWACYWPRMLHPVAIFFIGVIEDVLGGQPLGFSPVLYLVIYSFILSQRRIVHKEPFPVVWGVFALSAVGYVAGSFFIYSALLGHPWPGYAPIIQWAVTAALYPFFHQMCIWQQEYLSRTIRTAEGRRYGT